jgi:hypothetical protein
MAAPPGAISDSGAVVNRDVTERELHSREAPWRDADGIDAEPDEDARAVRFTCHFPAYRDLATTLVRRHHDADDHVQNARVEREGRPWLNMACHPGEEIVRADTYEVGNGRDLYTLFDGCWGLDHRANRDPCAHASADVLDVFRTRDNGQDDADIRALRSPQDRAKLCVEERWVFEEQGDATQA